MRRFLWIALLLAGCSRHAPAPKQAAPTPSAVQPPAEADDSTATQQEPAPVTDSQPFAEAPAPERSAPDAGTAVASDTKLEVGISREALLGRLGKCAQRVLVMTAGKLPTEVFQPKSGDCARTFGEEQFYVAGDRVARIQPGLSHYVPPREPETSAAR